MCTYDSTHLHGEGCYVRKLVAGAHFQDLALGQINALNFNDAVALNTLLYHVPNMHHASSKLDLSNSFPMVKDIRDVRFFSFH